MQPYTINDDDDDDDDDNLVTYNYMTYVVGLVWT